MTNQQALTNKIALITGASRGIGRAVAMEYAAHGAHVILLATKKRKLEKLYDEITENGGAATVFPFDLSQLEDIHKIGPSIYKKFGGLDIFVGNAGLLGTLSPLSDIKPDEFQKVMDINIHANFHLLQTLDPLLKRSSAGRVIFVTTGSEVVHGRAYWGTYAISKAALESMARIYAQEVAHSNIRVNLLNPGAVRTDMRAAAKPGENPQTLPAPDEITENFVYLASDQCQDHGQIIQAYQKRAA